MVNKQDFRRINDYLWEIPTSFHPAMKVPVWVFADEALLEDALGDLSITQAVNVAQLPGLVGHIAIMPDVHQGYGMPIGGVMATRAPEGVISPGAVGYDINCGVRVLTSEIEYEAAQPYLGDLASALYHNCPSGVGGKGSIPLSIEELDKVCRQGAGWLAEEAPLAYKDVNRVVETVSHSGIAHKVARLRPVAVVKG